MGQYIKINILITPFLCAWVLFESSGSEPCFRFFDWQAGLVTVMTVVRQFFVRHLRFSPTSKPAVHEQVHTVHNKSEPA